MAGMMVVARMASASASAPASEIPCPPATAIAIARFAGHPRNVGHVEIAGGHSLTWLERRHAVELPQIGERVHAEHRRPKVGDSGEIRGEEPIAIADGVLNYDRPASGKHLPIEFENAVHDGVLEPVARHPPRRRENTSGDSEAENPRCSTAGRRMARPIQSLPLSGR